MAVVSLIAGKLLKFLGVLSPFDALLRLVAWKERLMKGQS